MKANMILTSAAWCALVSTAMGQEVAPAGRGGGGGGAGRGRGAGGAASGAGGLASPAPQTRPAEPRTDSSVTTGTLKPSGRPEMTYTAIAGYMPLKDEQDRLRANIFHIDYIAGTREPATQPAVVSATTPSSVPPLSPIPADPAKRPITFIFNGGPGAASVWLHLGAVGPKRIDIPADGTAPIAPYHLIDNEFSWLPATDMVLIDPVGTGYSRAATPEQSREFYGVQEDLNAIGEFVRLWLTKNQRWGSPVFLAGESYGTTRAAALANHLQEELGVSVSGVTLISAVLNFETLSSSDANDFPFALYLPTYAAVASYHKKIPLPGGGLDALLKDAENFALNDYTLAIAKGGSLPDADRQRIAKRLSDLTGLSTEYILQANLRISPNRFEKELLRSKDGLGKVLGRYDARITGWAMDAINPNQDYDPSFTGVHAAYTSAFNDYVRRTLKYDNDLTYEVLNGLPWNFNRGGQGGGGQGFLDVASDLRTALVHNPRLRVLVCSGHYDLATPYFATDYTINHMNLPAELRKNISVEYFPGGHMLYHVHEGLEKLYKEETGFIEK